MGWFVRKTMSWYASSVLYIAACIVFAPILRGAADEITVVELENEECRPRPVLIPVGSSDEHYFPVIISLSRCGGACGDSQLSFRKCAMKTSNTVFVNVWNNSTSKTETVQFRNDTDCSCNCVYDASVCSDTQTWDEKECKCVCAKSSTSLSKNCPPNFIWNPNFCKCECDLSCDSSKQYVNNTDCSCSCQPKYYKRCNRKSKILRESDCKCYIPTSEWKIAMCLGLPAKWAGLIIVIIVCAFFIVAVDIILYCKGTGFIYTACHLCIKGSRNTRKREQRSASSMSDDTVDIVQCRSIKSSGKVKKSSGKVKLDESPNLCIEE